MTKKRIIAIILLVLATGLLQSCGKDTDEDETVNLPEPVRIKTQLNYFQEYSIPLAELSVKESDYGDLDEFGFYFINGTHGIEDTYDAQLSLIEYLVDSCGVRDIIMEIGYCDAMLLNSYLRSGDYSLLTRVMEGQWGTDAYNNSFFEFLQKIYHFNEALPYGKKLTIHSCGLQQDLRTGLDYLIALLPEDTEPPEDIARHIERLSSRYNFIYAQAMQAGLSENKAIFADYLGDNFAEFLRAWSAVHQGLEYARDKQSRLYSRLVIDNTLALYKSGIKYVGLYSGNYTDDSGNTLATLIEEQDESLEVASIVLSYYNCFYRSFYRYPIFHSQLDAAFASAMPSDKSFCPLVHETSPFYANGETELIQFMVIIKDSKSADIHISY